MLIGVGSNCIRLLRIHTCREENVSIKSDVILKFGCKEIHFNKKGILTLFCTHRNVCFSLFVILKLNILPTVF